METYLPTWLVDEWFYLKLYQWAGIILSITLAPLVASIFRVILSIVSHLAAKTKTDFDNKLIDSINGPIGYFGICGFWFCMLTVLDLPESVHDVFMKSGQVVLAFSIIWLVLNLSDHLIEFVFFILKKSDTLIQEHMITVIKKSIRTLVIVLGALVALQNLGINVMSLVAGLGLGGLAFALAAKDTAANLFGSIMILIDKPFKINDWIITGEVEGSVEDIGFRSTRVRTFYSSLVSIPNSQLANANIDNMGQRQYRRIKTTLGLTYDTPSAKIKEFVEGIKNIIRTYPITRKDYFQVSFTNYGPHSLDVLVYFFICAKDWNEEMDSREEIFLLILEMAEKIGVSFAFPTQSLHVESMPETNGMEKN